MAGCLGDDTIAAYVDGALELDAIAAVDRHIDGCQACRAQLSAVAAAPVMHSFVAAPGQVVSPSRSPTVIAPGAGPTTPAGLAIASAGDPVPGSALGRYIVDAPIGRGGMGVVVRAYDPELDRSVAIKLVDPGLAGRSDGSGAWRARLRTEARAMARLRHPNVVAVYDAGSVGDQLFVAMELVDGDNLQRWLTRRGRAGAIAACLAAGRGLCAAHAAGLVHGDVKPENILVDRDGRAMIGDFGLAHAIAAPVADGERGADPDGGERRLCGTPGYMAPELFRGDPADPRSDQFAYAVTVYEAIVGRRPWRGATLAAMRAAIGRGIPPRPPEIPAPLWGPIARGLAGDPAARFPSLVAFVDALDRAARRRRRVWLGVLVGTGAALAVGVVAVGVSRGGAPAPCPDPAEQTAPIAAAAAGLCGDRSGPTCAAVAAASDRRLTAWRQTHVAVCRATRDGRQSSDLLDIRIRCLDRRLAEHAALIDHLAPVPLVPTDAAAAVVALGRLAEPDRCATMERTPAYATPPPDRAAAIAAAEQWVAAGAADFALGRYRAGLAALAPHAPAIAALAYPPLTASASTILGNLQREAGELAAAEATFELGLRAAAEAGDDRATAELLLALAYLVGETKQDPDRGAELLRAASAAVVRTGNPPELESVYLLERGGFAEQRGDFPAAVADLTRAYQLRRTADGPDSGETAHALQRLCSAETQIGKLDEARAHCEQALAGMRRAVGTDHPLAAQAESELGVALAIQGDVAGARQRWEAALASLERSVGATSPNLVPVLLNLGDAAGTLGDGDAARRYLDRAVAIGGADRTDANNLELQIRIARQLRAVGELARATEILDDTVRRADAQLGPTHPLTASALTELAIVDYEAERYADARVMYERSIAAHSAIYGERHAVTLTIAGQYGQTLMELDDAAAARPVFERVMLALEATVAADSPFLAQAYSNFADCLMELGEAARAADLAEKGFAIWSGRTDDPLQLAESRFILGQTLWRARRDRRRAVALVRAAVAEMRELGPAAVSLPRAEAWLAGRGR